MLFRSPARGKEIISWADNVINEPIFAAISAVPCLPDRAGELQPIVNLLFPPDLDDATRLMEMWNSWVGLDRPWLHPSAFTSKERKLVVRRLLRFANKAVAPMEQWLEEVTYGKRLEDYEHALRIAVEIDKHHTDYRAAMRRSRIVLMQDGGIAPPITTKAFLPMDEHDEGVNLVSHELFQHGDAGAYLKALDFQALNDRGKVERIARQLSKDYDDEGAALSLWRLSRALPVQEMLSIIDDRLESNRLRVRAKDGKWRPISDLWLPNNLIPAASKIGRASCRERVF